MSHKRVAVIGGGLSGIKAIKILKEESLEPFCFEKTSEVGGTWCFRECEDYGTANVTSATTINHSKEMGAWSDGQFPKHFPNYMRHDKLLKYVYDKASEYDLLKHITCNREVVKVERSGDYEQTGQWIVTLRNTQTGEVTYDTFYGVLVCTGQFDIPNMPRYPGLEKFEGNIIHSQNLKTFQSFAGQRVVVVGTGCSALDAAVEISNVAAQVYLSVRTPSWIISRVGPYGLPIDYCMLRRLTYFPMNIMPFSWFNKLLVYYYLNTIFDHNTYGIYPKHPVMGRDPIVNDIISSKILSGTVLLQKNIVKIEKNSVIFEGENKVIEVDTLIFATGYKHDFPFLEKGLLIEEERGKIHLYKCVFPPHLKHPTFAFIGFVLPFGPGFPIGEIQLRWAARVISGKASLPSRKAMMEDVEKRFTANVKRYTPSDRMSLRVDNITYMDEVASEIGVKPNFLKMAFTDPRLFIACIFGPFLSYQYRLVGPHKWKGAREAILSAPERVTFPLNKNQINIHPEWRVFWFHFSPLLLIFFAMILLMIGLFLAFCRSCFH